MEAKASVASVSFALAAKSLRQAKFFAVERYFGGANGRFGGGAA